MKVSTKAVGKLQERMDLLLTSMQVIPKVYVDDNGIIYDVSLNQTNIGGNNNKVCYDFSQSMSRLSGCSSIACNCSWIQKVTSTIPIPAGDGLASSVRRFLSIPIFE